MRRISRTFLIPGVISPMNKHRAVVGAFLLSIALVACTGTEPGDGTAADPAGGSASEAAQNYGTNLTPDAGGSIIEVRMLTDEEGNNRFDPADFDAKKGDVIRFTLVNGVHNASFLPDSNPGKTGLPPAGPLLQLPQQTYDVKVTWDPGTHYFQCDPHALIGMMGHVRVQ